MRAGSATGYVSTVRTESEAQAERVRVGLGCAGSGLIIPRATGVVYMNETGGRARRRSELEGVFVPVGEVDRALQIYFEGPKHEGGGALGGLDAEDALAIDAIFARWSRDLVVDHDRLRDSYEAWVYVQARWPVLRAGIVEGLGPAPVSAVLTWTNSA